MDRVQVIKQESASLGGDSADEAPYYTPIEPQEDAIECAGVMIQSATARDTNCTITRGPNGDMLFQDPNNSIGTKKLTDLLNLLNVEPTEETGGTDATYTPTYSGQKVTKEEWFRNNSTLIKSIDYTYTGNQVTTEVRKVFGANGTTILAQVTWTYSYTGLALTGATMVRNV